MSLTVPLIGGAIIVLLVGFMAMLRPSWIPAFLAPTIVFEEVDLGGVSVARLGAALAFGGLVLAAARRSLSLPAFCVGLPLLGVFAAAAVASLMWTTDERGTILELVSLAAMLVTAIAFALLPKKVEDLTAVGVAFLASSGAMAAWWIVSYARGVDRFENPMGDPNRICAYLLIAAPISLALARGSSRAAHRLGLRALALLMVAGALATLSRGGLIAIAAAAFVVVAAPAAWLFRSPGERRRLVLVATFTVIIGASLVGPALVERFRDRPAGSEVTGTRGDLWESAAGAYRVAPATGIGFGAFRGRSFDLLRTTPGVSLEQHLPDALREGRYVHNAYLEALTEIGPVGLALFLAALIGASGDAVRAARRRTDPRLVAMAGATAVATAVLLASSLTLSTLTARVLGFVVGMAAALSTLTALETRTHGP